jgi:hypothetical protein
MDPNLVDPKAHLRESAAGQKNERRADLSCDIEVAVPEEEVKIGKKQTAAGKKVLPMSLEPGIIGLISNEGQNANHYDENRREKSL